MNGGWEGRRRTETPWVEIRGFRVLCVFQKRERVSAILPRLSGPEAGVGSAENPTSPPQMFTMPLGHPFSVRGGTVPERQAQAAAREFREEPRDD